MKKKQNFSDAAWEEGHVNIIYLTVTNSCQLRCKYCYIHDKEIPKRMDFTIAKKSIDYLLNEHRYFTKRSGIFHFFGGEPFLEIDLIDRMSDYIVKQLEQKNHKWAKSYKFEITTNGILYDNEKVQNFIRKHLRNLKLSITIDGTQRKHDLQRIYPDGKGSYDRVVKNIPLWIKQFPNAYTIVTIAKADIPYIKESVIHIWSLGIRDIIIRIQKEDKYDPEDAIVYEEQIKSLADYIIDHDVDKKYRCLLFSQFIGGPLRSEKSGCGAGRGVLAVDSNGDFYPCTVFLPYSINRKNKPERKIGNCFEGISYNKIRPFQYVSIPASSPQACKICENASGCDFCPAMNLKYSDTATIFERAIHNCHFHLAHVRANKYYFDKLKTKSK
ncbi:MAG: radical SAM peptide maturase, CXXX-repeat target family [Spirochaetales bacterium]|nr:radical SAM peptide maturase, CXXX-repeat target family [Spirochaetales bacterium]